MQKKVALVATATIDFIFYSLTTLVSGYEEGEYHSYNIFILDAAHEVETKIKEIVQNKYDWISLIFPSDLISLDQEHFLKTFSYYNKGEVANLSKYFAIKHVCETQDIDFCAFIDSDMLIYDGLYKEILKIQDNAVYLTPHILGPTTSDNDHEIMVHGWINAGFMVYNKNNEQALVILDWLISRISQRGFFAPEYSLSCDQTWVSALPVIFKDHIEMSSNPGVNVAYWNLFNRKLNKRDDDGIYTNDTPLLLFHFSGYDFKDKKKLSRHASYLIGNDRNLQELCFEYERRVDEERQLHQSLSKLKGMKCSSERLLSRINKLQQYNPEVDIFKTSLKPGIFSRMGSIIDTVIRKARSIL